MNLKEIEKVVASIQSQLFRNSNSFSVGMLKSHFKGAGLHFKEHQVYNPGDDVRFIDWNMSAKTNTTFIKTFEEERNVEIYAYLDISETMFMGYKGVSKLQAAIEIICLLYLLADRSKDKVGAIIQLDTAVRLPLASGQEGIIILISHLEKLRILNSEGKVDITFEGNYQADEKKKMALLKSLIAKGKEVVLLTDFGRLQDREQLEKLLYRTNMHCFKVESPLDNSKKMPFVIYGKNRKDKVLSRLYSDVREGDFKGRYKKINVEERYLEKFIREML